MLAVSMLAPLAGLYAAIAPPAAKPNIILIYSDDHGWADLGAQGVDQHIRTPHLDQLARDGVRFARGYVSAPQCVPSRAGLITGRYQQRFGVEDNLKGPLPLAELTIAERLKVAGYVSCQVGKWHLEPTRKAERQGGEASPRGGARAFLPLGQGFDEYFTGSMNSFVASHDLQGNALSNAPQTLTDKRFRCVWQTDAAVSFIERHRRDPFFLYLAYFTPHVPLESPEPWYSRTPAHLPKERRQALAMIAAMDEGIGRIRATVRELGMDTNTLIFFIGDNGAPLKEGAWNGSLNLPLVGEKGMLTDGGVRTPFVAAWPGTLPAGKVFEPPVINLDVAATVVALAGLPSDPKLDGVNLMPFLLGKKSGPPHDALFWRWRSQAAVLEGRWKLILLGSQRFLFDLESPEGETKNRLGEHPQIAAGLEAKLMAWNATLPPPGLPRDVNAQDQLFFDAHVNKTGAVAAKRPRSAPKDDAPSALNTAAIQGRVNAGERPNLVFILADDLGWADTTLYGHTKYYRTPNLERLAMRGMTFNRAYSASPLCSPTRASILTGLSPARIGITAPVCHVPEVVLTASPGKPGPPGNKATICESVTRLKTDYHTLAEALKDEGYTTGHFGKWHLGAEPYSPLQHGFDVDVPRWPGPGPAGSYVAPWRFPKFQERAPAEHIEDRMADEAAVFMEKNQGRPFFLNYWMFSVHAPFDAKQALIEKHRTRVNPADPQRSPTYAAMVESMDDAIGKLLDTLDRLGLTEKTIIVFTSDNGGNMYSEVDGTVPTSNAPLRGGKATLFEGGIRVPCIVSWPGVVTGGTRSDAVAQSSDFYPTLLEMLALKPREGQTFDGISLVPALKGQPLKRDAIFSFFPHQTQVPDWLPPAVAVHRGDWKLIRIFHGGEKGAHRWKLFNLANDLGEKNDLATQEPQRVKEMDALIEKFLADTKAVVPIPNPKFDPAAYRPGDEGKATTRAKAMKKAAPTVAAVATDADPLQGWKARGCKASVKDGVLTVRGTGSAPFLGFAAGKQNGPATVKLRLRSATGGDGKIEWLSSPTAADARSATYTLPGGEMQTLSIAVPGTGPLGILRIYLPATSQPVEIDWIELQSQSVTKPRRWDF